MGGVLHARGMRVHRGAVSESDRSPDAYGAGISPEGGSKKLRYSGKLRRFRTFSTTCVSRRCGRKCADSPRVRTPAQTGGGHRLPRAREHLHRDPQDCSYDSAADQCARLMHDLLPSRFRRLPDERPASAPESPRVFDASRPGTSNHLGSMFPRSAGCVSPSRDSTGALREANRDFNSFPVRFSPLVSRALGEAARQPPALR